MHKLFRSLASRFSIIVEYYFPINFNFPLNYYEKYSITHNSGFTLWGSASTTKIQQRLYDRFDLFGVLQVNACTGFALGPYITFLGALVDDLNPTHSDQLTELTRFEARSRLRIFCSLWWGEKWLLYFFYWIVDTDSCKGPVVVSNWMDFVFIKTFL